MLRSNKIITLSAKVVQENALPSNVVKLEHLEKLSDTQKRYEVEIRNIA